MFKFVKPRTLMFSYLHYKSRGRAVQEDMYHFYDDGTYMTSSMKYPYRWLCYNECMYFRPSMYHEDFPKQKWAKFHCPTAQKDIIRLIGEYVADCILLEDVSETDS